MDRYDVYNNAMHNKGSGARQRENDGGGLRSGGGLSGSGDTASIIRAQDQFLEGIANGFDKQLEIAQGMQSEMVIQNQLIDSEMPDSVDEVMARLQRTTRKAKELRQAAGLGWYYLINALLFMAFCVILIIGVQSGGFENGGFGACGEDDDQ